MDPMARLQIAGDSTFAIMLAAQVRGLLEDRARVRVALAHVKHAEAPRGVERLDDHLARLLGEEGAQLGRLARHDRRRAEVRILEHGELFVLLAQAAGVVDDERLAARALEHERREVVVEVERRILAHEHRLAAAQGHGVLRAEQVVVAGDAAHRHGPGARHGVGVLEREVARLAEPDLVLARLGRQHDREGRVARDLQAGHRVHDEEELHGSILAPNRRSRRRRPLARARPP